VNRLFPDDPGRCDKEDFPTSTAYLSAPLLELLVTHSALEAERCCDRVAVLVCGRLCALGSAEQLRARYSAAGSLRVWGDGGLEAQLRAALPVGTTVERETGEAMRCFPRPASRRPLAALLAALARAPACRWELCSGTLAEAMERIASQEQARREPSGCESTVPQEADV